MTAESIPYPDTVSKRPCTHGGTCRARALSTFERFTALVAGGPILLMTAQFGRSPVRDAAYRLRDRRRDLDLKPSWRLFASLQDWGRRWPTEHETFLGGLILSGAGDPVTDRAVGRCVADFALHGRPVLWGIVGGQRIRWQPSYKLAPNGWQPEEVSPCPFDYARLSIAPGAVEFRPTFDAILYSERQDYSPTASGLHWHEDRFGFFRGRRFPGTLWFGLARNG